MCSGSSIPKTDRHIVQIFSADEKDRLRHDPCHLELIASRPLNKTVITFRERSGFTSRKRSVPGSIRGRTLGEEFVYPKSKAVEIAHFHKDAGTVHACIEIPVEVSEPIPACWMRLIIAQLSPGAGHGDPAHLRSGRAGSGCHTAFRRRQMRGWMPFRPPPALCR